MEGTYFCPNERDEYIFNSYLCATSSSLSASPLGAVYSHIIQLSDFVPMHPIGNVLFGKYTEGFSRILSTYTF
jgi:hypothetical protein